MAPATKRASSAGNGKAPRGGNRGRPKDVLASPSDIPSTTPKNQPPGRRLTLRRRAGMVLEALYRLADVRQAAGIGSDPQQWAFALAVAVACRTHRYERGSNGAPDREWHELTLATLRAATDRCGLSIKDEALRARIKAVRQYEAKRGGLHLIGAKRLGEILEVSTGERTAARAWCLDAIDEPPAVRRARVAQERRVRDRERKRTQYAREGRKSRARYLEENALTRTEPWKAEGISKATYYRQRKARETGLSTDDRDTTCPVLYDAPADTPVSTSVACPGVERAAPRTARCGAGSGPSLRDMRAANGSDFPEPRPMRPWQWEGVSRAAWFIRRQQEVARSLLEAA